jgi:hypothetical protein
LSDPHGGGKEARHAAATERGCHRLLGEPWPGTGRGSRKPSLTASGG